MKKYLLCSLLSALFLALSITGALAGGGINYKVKVKNPTEHYADVRVNYPTLSGCDYKRIASLAPGETQTLEFGANCPSSIYGYIGVSNGWVTIRNMGMSAISTLADNSCGGASCSNHDLKICRKSGSGSNAKDHDYGFCTD